MPNNKHCLLHHMLLQDDCNKLKLTVGVSFTYWYLLLFVISYIFYLFFAYMLSHCTRNFFS